MIDGAEHLVFPCVSDLQVRESLLRAEADNKPAVLLCSMPENTLGDDVMSRFAKHKVFAPQLREMVAELFSARIIDPRVLKTKPLMNGLLEKVPVQGYPPVPGGTLDLQTAWLALLSQIIGETRRVSESHPGSGVVAIAGSVAALDGNGAGFESGIHRVVRPHRGENLPGSSWPRSNPAMAMI